MKNHTLRSSVFSPRFLWLKPTWLLAALLLNAATWSGAQSLTNSLRIENTLTNLRLEYSLANSNGAFFFLQGTQFDNLLGAGQVIASGIAASNPVGTVAVGLPTNAASFFGLLHEPTLVVSPEGFIAIDDGDAPDAPVHLLIASPDLPNLLTANAPFPLTLHLVDTNGILVSTNGQIALFLEQGDAPVTFNYTLLPATVGVTNGIGQTTLTIQTTNSLAEVFLAGRFTGPLGPVRSRDATTGTTIRPATVPYAAYSDPDTVNWRYPLPTVVALSGAFGEWPGHNGLHFGIDLPANIGTSVFAAKKGVVIKVDDVGGAWGKFVAVYHGNGYVTRYLHLVPSVTVGRIVDPDDPQKRVIGKVADTPYDHLHFEMLQLNNPSPFNQPEGYLKLFDLNYGNGLAGFPGVAVNPVGNPAFAFSQSLFTSEGQIPRVKAVFFRATHPALTALSMDPATPCLERLSGSPPPSPVYVVLQVVQETSGGVLPPRQITFTPDAGPAASILHGLTSPDIKKLDPRQWTAANGPGYALLPDKESNPNTARLYRHWRYKYWFSWDTSQYTSSPHSFTVQTVDLLGVAAPPVVFTYGPQIKNGALTPLGGQQHQFTLVANLGAGAGPALVQPDQYRLQVLQANGSAVSVTWAGLMDDAAFTRKFTAHAEERVYTFTLPGGSPDGLKLRVSSRLAPDLAHQVDLLSAGMALIPAGSFQMGDNLDGDTGAQPVHTVYLSAFYMDKYEVTKALWDEVYNWAITHGYSFDYGAQGKAANHPAQGMTWYDAAKWCNARSEKEGRLPAYYTSAGQMTVYRSGQVWVQNDWVKWSAGYRLPTEAEWEKAARGGSSGQRFPWGNTITHSQANYYSSSSDAYDVSPTREYHPAFNDGVSHYTSPVGSFAPNAYGLYDMVGNVWELCWDRWSSSYYITSPSSDPRGSTSGSRRVNRGGGWYSYAIRCRTADRDYFAGYGDDRVGFRSVLPPGQ